MKNDIHVLFKFASNPYGGIEIDTTSNSGRNKDLSPFVLNAEKYGSKNFENLWQFSKVYFPEHVNKDYLPNDSWYTWNKQGFLDPIAQRYPMGKGRKPLYSWWNHNKLNYIEARKQIYATIYSELVRITDSFEIIKTIYETGETLILRDYDAYDHIKLGISLKDVINNPNKKCGHAFILAMILRNELEECIK